MEAFTATVVDRSADGTRLGPHVRVELNDPERSLRNAVVLRGDDQEAMMPLAKAMLRQWAAEEMARRGNA